MATKRDDMADALTVLVVGLELVRQRWDLLAEDDRTAIVACLSARTDQLTAMLFPSPVCVDLTVVPDPPFPARRRSAPVARERP